MVTWYQSERLLAKLIFGTINKIVTRDKKICYNIYTLWKTACMVVNPIIVNNFAFFFNCMTVGQRWLLHLS